MSGSKSGPEHVYREEQIGSWVCSYWAEIPPFHALPSIQYWISFQAIADLATYGQWYWTVHEPLELDGAFMDSEYAGVPRWTPLADIGLCDLTYTTP